MIQCLIHCQNGVSAGVIDWRSPVSGVPMNQTSDRIVETGEREIGKRNIAERNRKRKRD